jgi:hypothetical protein
MGTTRTITKLLKLQPYKTTGVPCLQLCDPEEIIFDQFMMVNLIMI